MQEKAVSLSEIQEVPKGNLILLSGPPGAGKSTFCQRVVLNALAMARPVIFVTTERGPAQVAHLLREDGMGKPPPGAPDIMAQVVPRGKKTQSATVKLQIDCKTRLARTCTEQQSRSGNNNGKRGAGPTSH